MGHYEVESLHELGSIERRENVIFLWPPSVGKTHLAIEAASNTTGLLDSI